MNNSSVSYLRKPLALLGVGLSLFAASAAFAQTTAPKDEEKKDATVKLEKFVVTGSYLPVTSLVTASPLVTIERSSVGMSGATDVLGLLKDQTPFFAGNGNVGTELNNGGNGQTFISLRNLTTLTLLNGRRTVADVSVIPVSMIERVEILKDSASTVYGSDAIGGVVNFILRKNYDGVEIGGGMSRTGNSDYETRQTWMTAGVTLPGGFITVGAQYFENTQLGTVARKLTILTRDELAALGSNPANPPNYVSGLYPGRLDNDYLAGIEFLVGKPGYNAAINTPPAKASPLAAPRTIADLRAAGIYVPILTTSGGAYTTASLLNTALYNNANIVPTKRTIYTLSGEKDLLGKRLTFFGDFFYSDNLNGGTVLAPSPLAGLVANTLTIPANNPYNLFGVTLGVGQAAGAPNPITRLVEFGVRTSNNQFFTTRVVAGFKGEINEDYSWEVGFSYLKALSTTITSGGGLGSVMNRAMIPLLNAAGDQYVRDAQGKYLSILTDSAGKNLPIYNYFALPGFNDPRTIAAITTDLFRTTKGDNRSVDYRLSGRPFSLPAGDFTFVVGGATSRERIENHADSNFTTGGALGFGRSVGFPGGQRNTRSAFIETNIPLVDDKMDLPMLNTVDLTAAFRFEELSPGGKAKTPKFGMVIKPFDNQFLIRASYAKGFIAPSILALFGPVAGNAPTANMPFSATGFTGPGGAEIPIRLVSGQFLPTLETSNPLLEASKSTSWSAGVVIAPKNIKGLAITLDWYKIEQDKVGGFDYNAIVADLNAKGVGSIYASGLVFKDGSKMTTATTNQVTSTNVSTLTLATNPAGDQFTSGIDIDIEYNMQTASMGYFNFGFRANYLLDYQARANSGVPYQQYAGVFTDGANGLGLSNGLLADYIIKPRINWSYKKLRVSLSSTYIPSVQAPGSLFGKAQTTNNQRADGKAYTLASYHTENLSLSYDLPNFGRDWMKNLNITGGVTNLLDNKEIYVPGGGSGPSESNTNKSTYDIIGRRFFLELKKEF